MAEYDIYSFQEKRFTTYSHRLAIYIFGVDVSAWLKGSLSITYAGRESYNTASFELSNPHKIWQITQANLAGNFNETADEYDESVKEQIYYLKNDLNISPYFALDVTQSTLGRVSTNTQSGTLNPFSPNPFAAPGQYEERKYRLAVNDCIFNKNDFIRIFSKNPFSSDSDEWMEIFCGFIQEHAVTTNFLTGESRININASCIKQQMQKMRVQTNVHLTALDPQPLFNTGFYSDFIQPGLATHPFATDSLDNTIKNLVLGTINPASGPPNTNVITGGVGQFQLGNIVCYDPSNPGNTLERWHLMTIFGVNLVPFPQGGGQDELWLSTQEMVTIGEATYPIPPTQKSPVGGPTARYLHMLLPKAGTGAGGLISFDTIQSQNVSQSREWTSRWEIIRDFASKLDFQVMTSPSGDILVEFPQYGFTPTAYLTNPQSQATPGQSPSPLAVARDTLSNPLNASSAPGGSTNLVPQTGNTQGSLANIFVFNIHQKEETLSDEAEDFPNVLQVGGGMAFSPTNINTIEVLNSRAYVYSPVLVSRYGIVSESIDYPFAGQRSSDLASNDTNASPLTKRLAQLGLLEFTKRFANSTSWQGSLVYRPFMFPNRPIHLQKSSRMGLISSVTYQWNIRESASLQLSANMLMAQRSDGSYRLITGSVNCPIDYHAIWGNESTSSSISGAITGVANSLLSGNKPKIYSTQDAGVFVQTGQTQQQSSAVQTTQSTASPKNPVTAPATPGLNDVFPPFADLVNQLIAGCQKAGLNVFINNAYRSPDRQVGIVKNGTKPAAEPFLSLHQYGLAVDLNFNNVQGVTDARYNLIQQVNQELDLGLNWGGNFSTVDKVHFQAPLAWGMNGHQAKAISDVYRKQGLPELTCVQQVWNAIYARVPSLNKNNADIGPPLAATSLDTANQAFSQAAAAIKPGDKSQVDSLKNQPFGDLVPAAPCSQNLLQTPGLSS